ncbi:MAG: type II toxin-antitoxin system RelE/ParE family toxin [Caldilineaceae bacterium]|nr:type II toxin-antitoxin system RelE/ParE family toxin [Caldilineaceae bacterium]MDE0430657.1 type II toxin-antitoxin system RelE/ParE family toxin [Caldilineaceae bacterium]
MIQGFKDRKTRRFFAGGRVREFQGFADQAVRRLTVLDNAESLQDLAQLPSNRLQSLSGDRAGEFSIRINRQWRLCFRWGQDGPYDVEIVDYHT